MCRTVKRTAIFSHDSSSNNRIIPTILLGFISFVEYHHGRVLSIASFEYLVTISFKESSHVPQIKTPERHTDPDRYRACHSCHGFFLPYFFGFFREIYVHICKKIVILHCCERSLCLMICIMALFTDSLLKNQLFVLRTQHTDLICVIVSIFRV